MPKNQATTATRTRARSPRRSATTTWSGSTRPSATWCPRDIASRAGEERLRRGPRRRPEVGGSAAASTSTSPTRSTGWARTAVEAKYGNLFDMYARITGENPYEVADAHLPRRALHDGRPVGRLRPAVDDPRPVRDRRGQLLRPRRQPARRLRADAGPGRRLLRAARTRSATTSPTGPFDEDRPTTTRRSSRPRQAVEDADRPAAGDQRRPHASTPSTASSATSCGSTAAWSAPRRACARRST